MILIIGLLAAIALPAFLTQRVRAQDTEAKSAVRNARTTLAAFHTDRATYDTDATTLIDLEPSLAEAKNLTMTGDDNTFTVSVDSEGHQRRRHLLDRARRRRQRHAVMHEPGGGRLQSHARLRRQPLVAP